MYQMMREPKICLAAEHRTRKNEKQKKHRKTTYILIKLFIRYNCKSVKLFREAVSNVKIAVMITNLHEGDST